MTDRPRLDNQLKVYRAMHDLTQAELARRVDVSRKTISRIETRRFVPSTELALKLARELDATVEDLFQLSA
jgi:putative transcriptional regulator